MLFSLHLPVALAMVQYLPPPRICCVVSRHDPTINHFLFLASDRDSGSMRCYPRPVPDEQPAWLHERQAKIRLPVLASPWHSLPMSCYRDIRNRGFVVSKLDILHHDDLGSQIQSRPIDNRSNPFGAIRLCNTRPLYAEDLHHVTPWPTDHADSLEYFC